ncbi:MAG: M14 family zinc carboxypeptidase [Promethearchaeota archaeon]
MTKKSYFVLGCFFLTFCGSFSPVSAVDYTIMAQNLLLVRDWPNVSLIYPNKFHTPPEVVEELELLNDTAPDIIDLFTIGDSIEGRAIYCVRVTNEQNPLPKAGTMIVSHQHSREQITVEAALRFLHRLVNNYGTHEEITQYIDSEEIFVIPDVNPDGLHYVLGNETLPSDYWLRKNLRQFDDDNDGEFDEDPAEDVNGDGIVSGYDVYKKSGGEWVFQYTYFEGNDSDGDGFINEDPRGGVDLNRNFGYRWNDSTCTTGSTGNTLDECFPGTSAFSEPETQAYCDFVKDKSFAMAISLHSGINATYFPWASEVAVWPEPFLYTEIYNDLKDILPYRFFGEGYLGSRAKATIATVDYTSAGSWDDWMYAEQGCVVPMTFEIYHNGSYVDFIEVESENNTHLIERWDCIYEYFAPTEAGKNFDALWRDIQPAFDYWLKNTPRLVLNVKSVTGGNTEGDSVTVKLDVQNLSPRLSTVTDLNVLRDNFTSVLYHGSSVTISAIEAADSDSKSFTFKLEDSLSPNTNITFLIGNDYVGYSKISFQGNQITESTPVNIIIVLVAIPILITLKTISCENKRKR